ncbi:EthD domain-containing protein [Streptomyces lancefieldiae]|uniref:EthD domain-containing protein n=1 Tax=Streptomyces lancefieldiae TaxID=3075520 RepID=A0ABU3AGQ0_9ACTN|nr:EthD domain-containing protein [Streptomyces sp. DSM 40712]MDT0609075.1 EthD domain-containing protein [Streptomyces sp. DSM 40712]
MLKFIFMINRIEGMSFERFVEYHRNRHAPLFTSIPEAQRYVRKYTVSHPVRAENYPSPAYDGLTEIWFESWEDHHAFFASENYKKLVNPDEAKFIDVSSVAFMVTEEEVVIRHDSPTRPRVPR